MPHRYPYLAQDRLLALRLDNDFEMSAGATPPSGAAGGAGRFKFWMDTSVNPPALRMATAARATAGVYVATEWATLATLDLSTRLFNFIGSSASFPGGITAGSSSFPGGITAGSSTITSIQLTGSGSALNIPNGGIVSAGGITGGSSILTSLQLTGTGAALNVAGGVVASGNSTFNNITITGTGYAFSVPAGAINVAGASNFSNGIAVAGNSTMGSLTLSGGGSAVLNVPNGGINVAGAVNAGSSTFSTIQITSASGAALLLSSGGITMAGALTAQGTGYAINVPSGAINVAGASNFSSNLNVAGQLVVAGGIVASSIQATGGGYPINAGTAGLFGGSLYLSGNGNSVMNVPTGGITVAGASSFPYIYGGAGNAGSLRCWSTGDIVCFRWNGSNLSFRLNEALENLLPYVLNFNGFQLDAGGPSGFELAAYSGSTPFVIFIDAVSDARLKDNIRDTEIDALGAILATPVREFDWNSDGRRYMPFIEPHAPIGLVAQEVQEHMPFVVGVKNYPEKDNVPVHDMHRLMYDRMAAYFVRAIQQLHDEITDLKQRLN